jgi:uncharacterized protein (DUF2147 family)
MRTSSKTLFAAAGFAAAVLVTGSTQAAAEASPVGRWVTISDKDGSPRSVIEISETGGALQGKVVKIYDRPGDTPQHLCRKCEGALKDKPVIGMTVVNGLKHDGDSWDGGTIFDPSSGNSYSGEMHLGDGGNKLVVRGYMGISLLGRSQTWIRESAFKP